MENEAPKIKILASQRELLLLKKASFVQILADTVTSIALEQGVPENELSLWILNDKAEYFEKIRPKKNPKKKIPKKA